MSDIIVAPFSNSSIRDWPHGHFADAIRLLLQRWDGPGVVRVVGTANQKLRAHEIVRYLPAASVVNMCGRLSWVEVAEALRSAACVIGNNSGICHLSGRLGTPTVCVFGGTHQRFEWRPRGKNVVLISRAIGCSPCQLDHNATSFYNKACLRDIDAKTVADAACMIMRSAVGSVRVAAP